MDTPIAHNAGTERVDGQTGDVVTSASTLPHTTPLLDKHVPLLMSCRAGGEVSNELDHGRVGGGGGVGAEGAERSDDRCDLTGAEPDRAGIVAGVEP